MIRETFLAHCRRQRAYTEGRTATYARILDALCAALEAGEPAWFRRLEAAWGEREFGPYYEAPLLLLAGLHREALAGRAPELAKRLPSCGGAGEGAGSAALEFLAGAPGSFFDALAAERLQTNEAGRAAGWLLAGAIGFMTRGTPFHLVDLGSSAGLTLVGDYLPRDWTLLTPEGLPAGEPPRWREAPFPVLSRAGLDARPRRPADEADRLWLKACIWPDSAERHAAFDRAAGLFLRLARETAGPKLFEVPFSGMAEWIGRNRPPHPDEGLLVFNSQATDFLREPEYRALSDGLAEVLKPWEDRAFWFELEFPRAGGEAHELRAHRWLEGRFETRSLATTSAHPRELTVLPGWDFLRPLAPPRPPRNTREEPARVLQPGTFRFPEAT